MTNRIITFHLLFAAQFVVIISGMFVNTKTGLASMALILMFTTICLIQLANDKQTNWKPGQNIMTYMCTVWLVYYFFEILNPNNVMEAWNIGLTPYALIPLICAFIVPIVIRTKKDIELLLIVWSIFVLIFTIKGYWQKNHGFSEKDLHFLYALGGWRTHLIWSGIRYFSCFSDAANYGVHAALSAVVFAISSFYAGSKKTFTFCMHWEDGVRISSGPAYVISHVSPMPLITGCMLRCRQSYLPSPLFMQDRNGNAFIFSSSLSARFMGWEYPEQEQQWESSWAVC